MEFLKTLLQPNCWVRNIFYDKEWDEKLNLMMANGEKLEFGTHTVTFIESGLEVWVCNYPYNYGYESGRVGQELSGLPSRATVRKLKSYIAKTKYSLGE